MCRKICSSDPWDRICPLFQNRFEYLHMFYSSLNSPKLPSRRSYVFPPKNASPHLLLGGPGLFQTIHKNSHGRRLFAPLNIYSSLVSGLPSLSTNFPGFSSTKITGSSTMFLKRKMRRVMRSCLSSDQSTTATETCCDLCAPKWLWRTLWLVWDFRNQFLAATWALGPFRRLYIPRLIADFVLHLQTFPALLLNKCSHSVWFFKSRGNADMWHWVCPATRLENYYPHFHMVRLWSLRNDHRRVCMSLFPQSSDKGHHDLRAAFRNQSWAATWAFGLLAGISSSLGARISSCIKYFLLRCFQKLQVRGECVFRAFEKSIASFHVSKTASRARVL